MHYFETIRPQQLLAQMLLCSCVVAAHTLEYSVSDYIVPTLMWELEELSTAMESIFTSYEQYLRSGKLCQQYETSNMHFSIC
jgi:hypothetical protein